MKTILRLLTITLLLSSCASQKKCLEKFPCQGFDSTVVKDSVIVVHDTVTLPERAIFFTDTLPCPDYKREQHTNGLTARVEIKNGKLTAICKADSLTVELRKERRLRFTTRSRKEIITVKEYVDHWYDPICRWITVFTLAFICGWIVKKVRPVT